MITTVVFDLDDTLYDETDFCRSGFRAAAQLIATLSDRHTPDDILATIWDCFITGNRGSTFDDALRRLGIPYDMNIVGNLVEVYRTHTPTLTLPAESRTALDALKDRYTLALLTDGYLPTQRLKVQALGIEGYFAAIVYTEELGREFWKPSPRGFERLIELLHARPEQTAYVADNATKDFIAPNQLGMLTVQLLRPRGLYGRASDAVPPHPHAAPKLRIDRIDRLIDVLARW
jgi:putative hydrolase of the HAD superfamily